MVRDLRQLLKGPKISKKNGHICSVVQLVLSIAWGIITRVTWRIPGANVHDWGSRRRPDLLSAIGSSMSTAKSAGNLTVVGKMVRLVWVVWVCLGLDGLVSTPKWIHG